jgi:hypothetical protein
LTEEGAAQELPRDSILIRSVNAKEDLFIVIIERRERRGTTVGVEKE